MSAKPSSDKDLPTAAQLLTNQSPGTFKHATGQSGNREFTAFQRKTLILLYNDPKYGLAIKRELEAYLGDEVNHGRLYPNLDTLVDTGYIDKSELDKRTNQYKLTEKGREQVRDWLVSDLADIGIPTTKIEHLLDDLHKDGDSA